MFRDGVKFLCCNLRDFPDKVINDPDFLHLLAVHLLNLANQDFTDKSDKDTYGGQISYIPWHSGSAILNAGYKSWELNYSFIYTGERYDVSANTPENYRLPWYTSDFSLAKKFSWRKYDFKLTLEVNNIFNQQYEVVRSYPMPGTNFKFILNLTI